VFVFLNTKEVDGSKNLGISMPRGSERWLFIYKYDKGKLKN
jgi:hypothetical protein